MRLSPCVALALSLFSAPSLTSEQQTFTDAASWAKQTANQALKPSSLPLNIDDYCKDAACKKEIRNPKASRLSDSDINSQKTLAFANNETAQAIQSNVNKGKPDIKNDPAMRFALLGQDHAFEVTHGISNAYVDCQAGAQCLFEKKTTICHAPTQKPVPCVQVPIFTPHTQALSYTCPAGWTRQGQHCHRTRQACRYDANNQVFTGDAVCLGRHWSWDGVRHSGYPAPPFSIGEKKHSGRRGCGSKHRYRYSTWQICGPVTETQPAQAVCPAGWTRSGGQCVQNHLSWQTQCTLIPACQPIAGQRRCLEPRGTRTINGIPTTLDCWKYEVLHACDLPNHCAQYADCLPEKRECSLKQNGVCIEEKVTKTCTTKTCRQVSLQCGEQSFCLDGECYVPEPTLNGHFDKSAAALAGLGEAAKGLGDPPKIFTGKPMQCSKKPIGLANCCKDGGWGTDIGLAQCSEEDKALGKAKEKGLTLYVGEYCAERKLGVCLRRKKPYCVYDSKLGKIIQEQGALHQLGKTLGSAKKPTCAPLTPEELSQINFEHIDFTEFYPELHDNIHLPDPNIIKHRLQSAVGG